MPGHGAHLTHPDAFAPMVREAAALASAETAGRQRVGVTVHLLVTGSSGLIGSALDCPALRDRPSVTRLVRPGTLLPSAAGVADVPVWDPAAGTIDPAGLEAAGPFDGVVHLAGAGVGETRWTRARKQVILESRTGSTRLLAETLAALPAPPGSWSAHRRSATTATGGTRC